MKRGPATALLFGARGTAQKGFLQAQLIRLRPHALCWWLVRKSSLRFGYPSFWVATVQTVPTVVLAQSTFKDPGLIPYGSSRRDERVLEGAWHKKVIRMLSRPRWRGRRNFGACRLRADVALLQR